MAALRSYFFWTVIEQLVDLAGLLHKMPRMGLPGVGWGGDNLGFRSCCVSLGHSRNLQGLSLLVYKMGIVGSTFTWLTGIGRIKGVAVSEDVLQTVRTYRNIN